MSRIRGRRRMKGRPEPKARPTRKVLRIPLDDEDFTAFESLSRKYRAVSATTVARILLSSSMEASRMFSIYCSSGDREAVKSAADFFGGLQDLAREAETALNAVERAATEGAKRCAEWLTAEKIRRAVAASASGPKVLKGGFSPK